MGADALALTLAAALVHAAWNALLAGSEDTQAATAAALVVGATAFAPVAVATWRVDAAAVPYVVGSVAAETAYVALLAAAYARADLSLVYPVARGSAPVFVLLGSVPGLRQAVGVLTVACGVVAVRGLHRPGPGTARDLGLALGVGACIATYTLIDAAGLHHAAALPYLWLVLAPTALASAGLVVARGGSRRLRRGLGPRSAAAGLGFFGAYGLVLVALTLAPAAAVAAVRETSVVFAVGLARVVLGERVTRARAAGAVVVAVGIALVAA